eukprot:410173-Rhodomonas_salina.5
MRCAVLSEATALPALCAQYALSVRVWRYPLPVVLRARYAKCGTKLGYAATRRALIGSAPLSEAESSVAGTNPSLPPYVRPTPCPILALGPQ